jgi:tetratricopeptide (TPR) repeat protein
MDFVSIDKYLDLEIPVGNNEIKDLEELVIHNPWFTLAHVLLLKAYKNENRQNYQESCRLTAFYTPSRSRLRKFIEKETAKISKPEVNPNEDHKKANKNLAPENSDRLLSFRNEYFLPEELKFLDEFANNDSSLEDDLITKFIKESPKIIPHKEIPTENPNTDNTLYNSGVVSETLAEIFFAQKLYEQSIECYNKLILLNPEKSIYFARKISEIKDIKK